MKETKENIVCEKDSKIFPAIGRVAIVDDKIEEVKGLMMFLSKHSIPYQYFDGKLESFPDEKKSIQLIFLDLSINGTTNPKMLVSGAIGNIEALISEKNGPYCIAFWSNNYLPNKEEIEKGLLSLSVKPDFCFDMDKTLVSSYNLKNDELFKQLTVKLTEGYKSNSITNLMNNFNDIHNLTLISSFSHISNIILKDVGMDNKLNTLVAYILEKEYGQLEDDFPRDEDKLNAFIPLLNSYLSSKFNNSISSDVFINRVTCTGNIEQNKIDDVLYNTEINIHYPLKVKYPKNVYLAENVEINFSELIGKDFKSDGIEDYQLVEIDVTHLCLVANKKENNRALVTGILIKDNNEKQYKISYKDSVVKLGKIKYNDEDYNFIVCCNCLRTVSQDKIDITKAIFSISDKFYQHIRSNIAIQYSKSGI